MARKKKAVGVPRARKGARLGLARMIATQVLGTAPDQVEEALASATQTTKKRRRKGGKKK
jgi:hypothetical protein